MMETPDKVLINKAEAYCSSAERCPADVETKLKQWGVKDEVLAAVMSHLYKERYLDGERYCRFFVRDKYRFNQWGRMKIVQALRMKHMNADEIAEGIGEIDESEYLSVLKKILEQKRKTIKAKNEYELNSKLIRFATGRGFTMDEILHFLKDTDECVD